MACCGHAFGRRLVTSLLFLFYIIYLFWDGRNVSFWYSATGLLFLRYVLTPKAHASSQVKWWRCFVVSSYAIFPRWVRHALPRGAIAPCE
jgi:hypothetical protein